MTTITPFRLDIAQTVLDDLRERLARTRWPERETVDDRSQGVPLADVQALCAYWRDMYDWRRCETRLNALGQYRTEIDGLGIHFLHVRSPEPDALPLILTHGWPGSVVELLDVIGPLSDPAAHGGDPRQAFHVVAPSLPGYGFSDRPADAGWSLPRIARAWVELMRRLGYDWFVAQGGDWGAGVTTAMAALRSPELAAIHLNFVVVPRLPEDREDPTEQEARALADIDRFTTDGQGYSGLQSTRPQTLGYALTDSPAGQAAWIYEKILVWSDPASVLDCDRVLDAIMLYWLPATAASSARLYWESLAQFSSGTLDLPVACNIFPHEIIRPSRRWAARKFPNIIHWGEPARGGHFAAFEQPALFVDELRAAFTAIRPREVRA
ncbi:epoxide hydrolase family protein [uncultured Sphingomonas sp.]|uniref:epoxide hydrolase family protein n=1 Tax=uncultured Sphingomonas sp. TaxID=158754 RepID=UPI002633912B|nr:epoxide hydrolase family protein [uncultured Sphingomonas sp.]